MALGRFTSGSDIADAGGRARGSQLTQALPKEARCGRCERCARGELADVISAGGAAARHYFVPSAARARATPSLYDLHQWILAEAQFKRKDWAGSRENQLLVYFIERPLKMERVHTQRNCEFVVSFG